MTIIPRVPVTDGVMERFRGDERTRTAASVPTSESRKYPLPDANSDRRCVSCPALATLAFHLKSGRVGWLCEPCLAKYPRPSVYFLRGGRHVKIGFSANVTDRVKGHQIGSPIPLVIWHVVEADRTLEYELHRRFAADRAHGEWFHITDAIRDYVAGRAA